MPIVNVTIPTERISVGDGYIEVRGVGFPEISQLIDANYEKLSPFFDRVTGKDKKNALTMDNIGDVPRELIVTLPAVVVHFIALAADATPDDLDTIKRLPADVQLAALEAAIKLTVKTAGGGAAFIEIVTRMLASVNDLQSDVSQRAHLALANGSKG